MPDINPLLVSRLAGAPRGEFVGNATTKLAELLNAKGGMDKYLGWVTDPFTLAVLGVIEDMARQPQGVLSIPNPHETAVQYGVTTGLQYAALAFRDPTAIIGGWKPDVAPEGDITPTYGVTTAPVQPAPQTAPKNSKKRG